MPVQTYQKWATANQILIIMSGVMTEKYIKPILSHSYLDDIPNTKIKTNLLETLQPRKKNKINELLFAGDIMLLMKPDWQFECLE